MPRKRATKTCAKDGLNGEASLDTLLDMHCHLDFADDCERIVAESEPLNIRALSSTVVPSSYVSDRSRFAGTAHIDLSLGLHPWWVAEGRIGEAEIASFENLLPDTPFIGEVGLDFLKRYRDQQEKQIAVFDRILKDIKAAGDGRLITIHAVKSATTVLDMLEENDMFENNIIMFHWFAGTHEEFGRALAKGCSFSVGMKMMATEAGRDYAGAIPDEQLLIETDLPSHEGSEWDAGTWRVELKNTLVSLAELRGCTWEQLAHLTYTNGSALLERARATLL